MIRARGECCSRPSPKPFKKVLMRDAANDVVRALSTRLVAPNELSECFVASFWQSNHHAERKRPPRVAQTMPLLCGGACGMILWRAQRIEIFRESFAVA